MNDNNNGDHSVKSIRIWSYSSPNAGKYGPEQLRIPGVYSSNNWPPFKLSFETQSFKPKNKKVIKTV